MGYLHANVVSSHLTCQYLQAKTGRVPVSLQVCDRPTRQSALRNDQSRLTGKGCGQSLAQEFNPALILGSIPTCGIDDSASQLTPNSSLILGCGEVVPCR